MVVHIRPSSTLVALYASLVGARELELNPWLNVIGLLPVDLYVPQFFNSIDMGLHQQ